MTDAELLQEYVEEKTESAFHALVERHLSLVYSSAFRQLRHPALSENVAHVTFLILAQKAPRLSSATVLPTWLFCKTRHVVSRVVRVQEPPEEREQEALRLQESHGDIWDQAALFIDDALDRLGDLERGAVLLHYFQNKRLRDVGPMLGMNEDAAEKCANRAIKKLQKFLAKRNVPIPLAAFPGLLMTRAALVAPSYLAADVAATALNKKVISTAVYSLLKSSHSGTVWENTRRPATAAAIAILILLALIQFWPRRGPAALAVTRPPAPVPTPQPALAAPTEIAGPAPEPILEPLATPSVLPVVETAPPRPPIVAVVQQSRPFVMTNPPAPATNQTAATVASSVARSNAPTVAAGQNPAVGPGFNLGASGPSTFAPQQSVARPLR